MASFDERLTPTLDGYASFLREQGLALPKHRLYLVRWVKDFLLFAKEHTGCTCEQKLGLFLAGVARSRGNWSSEETINARRKPPDRDPCQGFL